VAIATIACAAVVSTTLLSGTPFFELLHLKAQDLHFLLRGARPTGNVVLITIDQKALDTFEEPLLFWHPYYADAIRGAADGGAKAFGLDVTFAIPVDKWAPDLDQALVTAVMENLPRMPVTCAFVQGTLNLQGSRPVRLNMLAASMGAGALANLAVDRDDFIRRVELIEPSQKKSEDVPLRSLAARVAEGYLGTTFSERDGRLYLGERLVPTAAPRTITINHAGPAGTFPRVSLADFVGAYRAGRVEDLRKWVGGKAVLLGMDSVDDRHATPFYILSQGTRANTAGVEIQASVVDTLIDRRFLLEVPVWARVLGLLLVAAASALVAGTFSGRRLAGAIAVGAGLTLAATDVLFRMGWMLSDSELLMCAALSTAPVIAYRSLTAERRGSLFQRAVAVFVGGSVAESLDQSEAIVRTGKRQTVTILFTDIRGFTAFCESKDPADVVELLNGYLETMVSIIVRNRGCVDKFIGDGIMAVFSDSDKGVAPGTHAERAVRAAFEMVTQPGEFRTGAGIHTGEVVVGVVGSSDKMEHTALGNTVNTASRLESLNKEYKSRLLMSDETRSGLPGDLEAVCLGEVLVRGKTAPMRVFTLAALQPAPAASAEKA
jgi:adenylate cyclase